MDQGMQREWGEDGLPIGETDEERTLRERREAASIAEGYRDIAAGRLVDWHDFLAYLDRREAGDTTLLFPEDTAPRP